MCHLIQLITLPMMLNPTFSPNSFVCSQYWLMWRLIHLVTLVVAFPNSREYWYPHIFSAVAADNIDIYLAHNNHGFTMYVLRGGSNILFENNVFLHHPFTNTSVFLSIWGRHFCKSSFFWHINGTFNILKYWVAKNLCATDVFQSFVQAQHKQPSL